MHEKFAVHVLWNFDLGHEDQIMLEQAPQQYLVPSPRTVSNAGVGQKLIKANKREGKKKGISSI